jgi:hypothetical protein
MVCLTVALVFYVSLSPGAQGFILSLLFVYCLFIVFYCFFLLLYCCTHKWLSCCCCFCYYSCCCCCCCCCCYWWWFYFWESKQRKIRLVLGWTVWDCILLGINDLWPCITGNYPPAFQSPIQLILWYEQFVDPCTYW